MGLISRLYNFVAGDTIRSSEVDAEFDQILSVINGNINTSNLAANAVEESDIAAGAVTDSKISLTTIALTGVVSVTRAAAGYDVIKGFVAGDTIARIALIVGSNGGQIVFGPGTAIQMNLYQSAASTLTLDNNASGDITKLDIHATDTDFSGNVNLAGTADKYTHATTTKTIAYGASAAIKTDSNPAWNNGFIIRPSSADNAFDYTFWGIVDIPVGATITRIDTAGATSAGANNEVIVNLGRSALAASSGTTMATATYNNGGSSANDTSITNPVVDAGYYYWAQVQIRADSGGATTDAELYSLKITYTTANLSQT